MVQPSKYHDRTSPTGRLLKTWGNSEEDLDQEIDLDEILREMYEKKKPRMKFQMKNTNS